LKKGQIKSLELKYKRSTSEWWVYFQLEVLPPSSFSYSVNNSSSLPPAVLGIDLGINIPAAGVLLTPKKKLTSKEIKFWHTKQWNRINHRYKLKLSRLQRKAALNDQSGKKHHIYRFLGLLRRRYKNVKRSYIHQFINAVVQTIETYAQMYDLFVVVGYPKYVRKDKGKGKGKSTRYFRRKLHQWNFSLVLSLLRRVLILRGFSPHRILIIDYHSDLTGARNIARKFLSHLFRPRTTTITDYFTGQKFSLAHYTVCRGLSHWLQSQ